MFEIEDLVKNHGWIYISRPWDKTIWISDNLELNTDFLLNHKAQKSKLIVDMSIEHWGGTQSQCIDMVYKLLNQYFDDFILLSHSPIDHLRLPNLLFFPYWYYRTISRFHSDTVNDLPKRYKVSCLNGFPKFHRIANFRYLVDKPYKEDIFKKIHRDGRKSCSRPDDYTLSEDLMNWWKEYSESIEYTRDNLTNIWNHKIDGSFPAFSDSYINLVAETSVLPEVFVTEKTWKAVASGQLFVIFGNCHTVDLLKDLGVDVFDDIIDHRYYDQEPDWLRRLEKLHKVLDDLVAKDLYKIWAQTYPRRLANQNKFFAGDFGNTYKTQLVNRLS